MKRKAEGRKQLLTGWLRSAELFIGLLLVPQCPASDLLLSHAAEKRLFLRLVELGQQLGVHPHVLQDLLQHLSAKTKLQGARQVFFSGR